MKHLVAIFLFSISFQAHAISPDVVECDEFFIQHGQRGWELFDMGLGPILENHQFSGELRDMPEDNISFGTGDSYRELSFVSETIDSEGYGAIELDEVVNNGDYDEYHRLVCKAYTL